MRGSRGGGGGGGGPDPPWNLQSLISQILLEMKKLVIFNIYALQHLYVKVGPPPPVKIKNGSAPGKSATAKSSSTGVNVIGPRR